MAGFFTETIRAKLAGRAIGIEPLVLFDFASGARRLWLGYGDLRAGGETWTGGGGLVSISSLGRTASGQSSSVTFTLAGVPMEDGAEGLMADAYRLAAGDKADYAARDVVVYLQFFDVTGDVPLYPLDSPLAVWAGVMDVLAVNIEGPSVTSISLTCENENSDRRRPRYGLLTDADQQARYPGDKSCQFRARLRTKQLKTPW